ncbi:MAG: carotenoid 1,2-hydratase [Deltaproteobacteria bacterium]|nr:carotenoid 1,2-hydratase [Deltaproteobacteria bacterium]
MSNRLTNGLTRLQRNFREVRELIRWKDRPLLTPAHPHGPDIELFRKPESALISWTDKQTQRWKFLGHLHTASNRAFGYQLSFLQRNTQLDRIGPVRACWLAPRLVAAELALSDHMNAESRKTFRCWNKGGVLALPQALAGYAAEDRFHLETGGWYAKRNPTGTISIFASGSGQTISLHLTPSKPLVYYGQNGYLQQGPGGDDAEYACGYSLMQTRGTILLDGRLHDVTGTTWLEHEKSTHARSIFPTDRFLIQLETGEELMLNLIHDETLKPDRLSSGIFVDRGGNASHLISSEFRLETTKYWKSPRSRARYPMRRTIHVESLGLEVELKPFLENHEIGALHSSFWPFFGTRWAGPIAGRGSRKGEALSAVGFMELQNYL